MKKIWHPWHKWECYKAGFYSSFADIGETKDECQERYRIFLSDLQLFGDVLSKVITEWKFSCEHFLSDQSRNKIAWLGQASMAYHAGIPAEARGGYKLLTDKQQYRADKLAKKYLEIWNQKYSNIMMFGNIVGIQMTYLTKCQTN